MLLIDFLNAIHETLLSNNLPEVLNKKCNTKYVILFCVFLKKLWQIVKNHTTIITSSRWLTKIYFFGGTWKLVQLFYVIECLDQHKWWKHFLKKHKSQRFEPHWYGEAFLWNSHNRLLSKPWSFKFHTCSDDSVSSMHSLYGCYTVFWTPLQKFHSKQSCYWML